MKNLFALLLLVVVGSALHIKIDLTVNGTVFCNFPPWGYKLKVWELDHWKSEFLGEARKKIKNQYISTYSLQLPNPEFDGVFDSYFELGYSFHFHCGNISQILEFQSSSIYIYKTKYHEELFVNLMSGGHFVVKTCDENGCNDYSNSTIDANFSRSNSSTKSI